MNGTNQEEFWKKNYKSQMAFDPLRHRFVQILIFCFVTYLFIIWYISHENLVNVNFKSDTAEYNTFIINQGEKQGENKYGSNKDSSKTTIGDSNTYLHSNVPNFKLELQEPKNSETQFISLDPLSQTFLKESLNDKFETFSWKDYPHDDSNNIAKPTKNPAFIIDTSTCKIPKFDLWDSTVRKLIHIKDPFVCPGLPLFMTAEPNGIINLDLTVLEKYYNYTRSYGDINCWYWPVVRKYEPNHTREDTIVLADPKRLDFYTPIKEEHIAVKCYFENNFEYEQYFPLVRLKDEVENKKSKLKPASPLNVILLGIDSVSKLNFLRHFRETKAFLKEKLEAFDMKGYIKVADNTFLNIVPMLTGHFAHDYWNETIRDTFFFDNISLIWKDYAKQGYRTFFADDAPFNGIFNYYKRGFFKPPTDYYYRPTALMIEHSEIRHEAKKHNSTCINSQLETDLMYDYLLNFVKTMDDRPYFAFCMVSILTHDDVNNASFADAPTARLLQGLDEIGALDSSALVVFSDHGIRYGEIRGTYIGKFEERMPFMYIHFPRWFLDQHPYINKNLFINQDRLTTLFDIHATLKNLLSLNEEFVPEFGERGLSLFDEIPESRTCDEAFIQQHWCPCNNFKPLDVNDPVVIEASQAIVDHINLLLKPYADVCETLELTEIKDAHQGLPDDRVLKYQGHVNEVINEYIVMGKAPPTLGDYLITLTVKPGGAILEGTVRYNAESNISSVMDVSRINMYGMQSWCIDSPRLKLYCYCKEQIE